MSLNMPQTAIAFQGGAYGNYFHWILYSLLNRKPLQSPFEHSTSHDRSYIDPALLESGTLLEEHAVQSDLTDPGLKLSTIHPVVGTDFDQDFIQNLTSISDQVDRVVIPYCDHSTYLLGVNNYMYKICPSLTKEDGTHWNGPLWYINKEDFLQGWGIHVDTVDGLPDMNKIPKWIRREHHSMNVFDVWEKQCGWFAPEHFAHPKCKFIFLHDLFYDFLNTIETVRQHLDVEWVRDPQELMPFHQRNIANQTYLNQDRMAQSILDSVINNTNYTWNTSDLTLYTEAYIQRRLQPLGYMLKCNELDVFPTSTNELLEICE